jgi:excisionase family DNA binding protein
MGPDDILTTTEVAQQIGVARQTVDRWIREGKLRARRIHAGKRAVYRIRRGDMYDFVRKYVSGDW